MHTVRPLTAKYTSASVRMVAAAPNNTPPTNAPRHPARRSATSWRNTNPQSISARPKVCSQKSSA